MVGLVYNSASRALVVDAGKIKSYDDFKNPENSIVLKGKVDLKTAVEPRFVQEVLQQLG